MFKKVLLAEDHESANISVRKTLTDLGVLLNVTDYVYYCDHAVQRLQRALRENEPYELLITDLSFDEDYVQQQISKGPELIKAAREMQPDLKILVFSVENRAAVAEALFADFGIDAYVPKGRRDANDLKLAIEAVYRQKKYMSPNIRKDLREKPSYTFTEYDKIIISLLLEVDSQKDIPQRLKAKNIKPSSLSSVEKRLNLMREVLGFSKNEQLIAYCKDIGII